MNSIIFLFFLVLKGFEATFLLDYLSGRKRDRVVYNESKEIDIEDGNVIEIVPNPKRIQVESFYSKEDAFKIFYRCDKKKIDELLSRGFEILDSEIWEELIQKREYTAIKYMLKKHFHEDAVHQKVFLEAIEKGSTALALYLLKISKLALWLDKSRSLKSAIIHARYNILKAMNDAYFNANVVIDEALYRSPLHLAVVMDDLQSVKMLLKFKSVKVNFQDLNGNTPLHLCESVEVARVLIASGADKTANNLQCLQPIDTAAQRSLSDLVFYMEPSVNKRLDCMISAHLNLYDPSVPKIFRIDRERVLEDSFTAASRELTWYRKDFDFKLKFVGESGVDQGGLTREWMSLLIERLFVPRLSDDTAATEAVQGSANYELEHEDLNLDFFGSERNDYLTYFPSTRPFRSQSTSNSREMYYGAPFECVDADNKMYKISEKYSAPNEVYKFIGSIVARAIFKRIPLKVKLVPSLLRLALDYELSFDDLLYDDPVMHRSMLLIRSDDFNLESAFYEIPSTGELVTRENIDRFLNETAVEYMYGRQKKKIDLFVEGFRAILPQQALNGYFTSHEILDILYGSDGIDRTALPRAIQISGPTWRIKGQIFWNALAMLSDEELIQLIRFITGINGLPFGGVSNLGRKIKIFDGDHELYPHASTCFYTLTLPVQYDTSEDVYEGFKLALSSTPEFNDGCC